MKKVIVLFETIDFNGSKKYVFAPFDFNPETETCGELSLKVEKDRKNRLIKEHTAMFKKINIVGFQII